MCYYYKKIKESFILSNTFPNNYPDNLLELIINDGAQEQNFEVYRVCRNGLVNRDAFNSTFQEKPNRKRRISSVVVNRDAILNSNEVIDIGEYSTSVFENLKPAKRIITSMSKYTPEQIVAKGTTNPACGLSMRTEESKSKRNCTKSHIDWWIYENSNPEDYFEEIDYREEI